MEQKRRHTTKRERELDAKVNKRRIWRKSWQQKKRAPLLTHPKIGAIKKFLTSKKRVSRKKIFEPIFFTKEMEENIKKGGREGEKLMDFFLCVCVCEVTPAIHKDERKKREKSFQKKEKSVKLRLRVVGRRTEEGSSRVNLIKMESLPLLIAFFSLFLFHFLSPVQMFALDGFLLLF